MQTWTSSFWLTMREFLSAFLLCEGLSLPGKKAAEQGAAEGSWGAQRKQGRGSTGVGGQRDQAVALVGLGSPASSRNPETKPVASQKEGDPMSGSVAIPICKPKGLLAPGVGHGGAEVAGRPGALRAWVVLEAHRGE